MTLTITARQHADDPNPAPLAASPGDQPLLAQVPASRLYVIRCVLMLIAMVLLAHGLSLFDGVVLDDYWHQKGLREHGWSFPELMRTLIIAPSDFLDTWWQTKDVRWHYLRPFFIVCMKFVYTIVGRNDPAWLHGFSILLHAAGTLMVWWLCWKLTRQRAWSFIGGLMFAIYPHSIVTVAWPSSQNVVIQNALLLAMLLAYVRASGLSIGPESWRSDRPAPANVPRLYRPALVLTVIFWLLAISTRENAILMPAVLLAFDVSFGGWRHLWARKSFYVFCGLTCAGFMAWRQYMHIPPLPDVYCRRPDGDYPEYLAWLAAKFLHYVCVSIWPGPLTVGPTGRLNPWTEVPGDCLLMLAIVAAVGAVYFLATRRARGWWIWPLWIALSILPVAAVVATPHSGYMSGVGFAVGLALAGTAGCAAAQARLVRRVTAGLIAFLVLGMAFMSPVNRLQWIAIYSAERYVPSWVMASPPPRQTCDVFFVNLPFVNVYLKPNLVSRLGPWFENVNVHVLTWSPNVLMVTQRTIVEQLDDHSFTAAIEGRPYFSGTLGRFVLEAFRGKQLFRTGDAIKGPSFDVLILDADDRGVRKLKFTFPRPLNDPSYCFYLSSENCGAARLRFQPLPGQQTDGKGVRSLLCSAPVGPFRQKTPDPFSHPDLDDDAGLLNVGRAEAALPLFEAAMSSDESLAKQADMALRPVVAYMADVLGSPVRPLLDQPALSADQWRQVRDWWARNVDDRALAETWLCRHQFDYLVWLRAEIDWDRWLASFVFQTDLYMTGPPYPSPRGW